MSLMVHGDLHKMTYETYSSIMIPDLEKKSKMLLRIPKISVTSNVKFLIFSLAVFICSFMVAAPIFGYLGDRFNRKVILSCGIFFWSAVTLLSSFITKEVRGVLYIIAKIRQKYSLISKVQAGDCEMLSVLAKCDPFWCSGNT